MANHYLLKISHKIDIYFLMIQLICFFSKVCYLFLTTNIFISLNLMIRFLKYKEKYCNLHLPSIFQSCSPIHHWFLDSFGSYSISFQLVEELSFLVYIYLMEFSFLIFQLSHPFISFMMKFFNYHLHLQGKLFLLDYWDQFLKIFLCLILVWGFFSF